MQIQPRGYKRNSINSRVALQIEREVIHTSERFGVSKSWVVAVALAETFGIKIPSYIEPAKLKRVK